MILELWSLAAMLFYFMHIVTNMLLSNPYVIVISVDFSNAFDTVRHFTLLEKMAELDMPEYVYNWIVNYFSGHSHCTVYNDDRSAMKSISASIIQGSAIGPSAYVVTAGDLTVV